MPDATAIYDFLGKLLGATPPQPQAQPQSPDVTFAPGGRLGMIPQPATGATTPAQPAHYSLMDVLGSPGAQGALQAYFSLLSQPRVQGWGRGLGAAGLQGLQGFEQARAAQAKLPLEQAQLEEARARVPALRAETKKSLAEAGAYEGLSPQERKAAMFPGLATSEAAKAANNVTADNIAAEIQADKTITPEQRKIRLGEVETIRNYPTAVSLSDARQLVYGKEYEPQGYVGPKGDTKWIRPGIDPVPEGYHLAGKPKVISYVKLDDKNNIAPR